MDQLRFICKDAEGVFSNSREKPMPHRPPPRFQVNEQILSRNPESSSSRKILLAGIVRFQAIPLWIAHLLSVTSFATDVAKTV